MGRRFFVAMLVSLSVLVSGLEAGRPIPRVPRVNPPAGVQQFKNEPHIVPPQLHPGGHNPSNTVTPASPQRVAPVLKRQATNDTPRFQERLVQRQHWQQWQAWNIWTGWLWGTYGYLPENRQNTVARVPSGNTLSVTNGLGAIENVRLAGVGAPAFGQAMFSESTEHLSELAQGQTVRVFEVGRDDDGTMVAQVFLDSGACLNESQIGDGYAWNSVDDGYDQGLAKAEEAAQLEGKGMWGADYSAAF